jgi:hypothetical protein
MDLVFRHNGQLCQASEFIELSTNDSGALPYSQSLGTAFFISQDSLGNWLVRAFSEDEWAKLRPKYSMKVRTNPQNVVKPVPQSIPKGIIPLPPRQHRHPAHQK